MTLHPEGLEGVNIERNKYEVMRDAIHQALKRDGRLKFKQLSRAVKDDLGERFDGSIGWYMTTVKLDLEARGEIVCTRKSGGQWIELAEQQQA